jgi:hypothetical protein
MVAEASLGQVPLPTLDRNIVFDLMHNMLTPISKTVNRLTENKKPEGKPSGQIGAVDWTRTSTSVAHYPLKIACLPIPPPRRNITNQAAKYII